MATLRETPARSRFRTAVRLKSCGIMFGYGIAGTLAHEYAHQLQFHNGWMRPTDNTVRTTELEADAFSGVYMGLVKGFGDQTIRAYFATLASFGDYYFN